MDDLEDVLEAVVEIEEIAEEVTDPDDLFEDFVVNPLAVVVGLAAAFVGLVTILLFLLTVVLVALAFEYVVVVAALAVLCLFLTVVTVGVFLAVRSTIPADVRHEIGEALRQADDTPSRDAGMSEQEAITRLKDLYAEGEIGERELERGLDDVLTSDDPGKVVEQYERRDAAPERRERY